MKTEDMNAWERLMYGRERLESFSGLVEPQGRVGDDIRVSSGLRERAKTARKLADDGFPDAAASLMREVDGEIARAEALREARGGRSGHQRSLDAAEARMRAVVNAELGGLILDNDEEDS